MTCTCNLGIFLNSHEISSIRNSNHVTNAKVVVQLLNDSTPGNIKALKEKPSMLECSQYLEEFEEGNEASESSEVAKQNSWSVRLRCAQASDTLRMKCVFPLLDVYP